MLSAPVLVIPDVAPQPESASPVEEGSADEVPPDTLGSTTEEQMASITPASEPPPANPGPIPSTVPTIQGKRPSLRVAQEQDEL